MASTVIGFKGKDFVILAADGNLERQYIKSIIDFNRIYHVEGNRLIGVVGETPEVQNLASFVQRNLALQHYVNGNKQTTESVVHWMHRQIADNLRKRDGMFFQKRHCFVVLMMNQKCLCLMNMEVLLRVIIWHVELDRIFHLLFLIDIGREIWRKKMQLN